MTGRLKLLTRPLEAEYVAPQECPTDAFPDESATASMQAKTGAVRSRETVTTADSAQKKRGSRNTVIKGLIGGALAIALATVSYNAYQYFGSHEETDDATISGHIHIISPRVSGNVSAVLVDDNQHVQKGQLLFKLDPRDYDVQVAQAKAELELAQKQADAARSRIGSIQETAAAQDAKATGDVDESEAALANAQERVIDAQAGVAAAKEQLVQAQATLEKNTIDYKRYAFLEKQGAVSTQQLDASKRDLAVSDAAMRAAQQGILQAQARLAAAQKSVQQAMAHTTVTKSEVHSANASRVQIDTAQKEYEVQLAAIQQAQTKLQDALLQRSYTEVVAPVSGTIGRKSVEVGQRLQPAQQVLAIVPDDVWVVANFKETQLAHMHNGQKVELKVDAFPQHAFTGRIDSLSPASGSQFALLPPDNATGNFTKIVQRLPVKIVFDRNSIAGYTDRLAPGMSVIATVDTVH